MKLCRYWALAETVSSDAQGKPMRLRKWGGSNASLAEAKAAAEKALQALRAKVEGVGFASFRDYTYSMRDVPEELLREITADSGVTRNAKGCEVLNAASAFFADIDIRPPGFIARLFGVTREKAEEAYLEKLRRLIAANPAIGARIYRTRAGLRYLFTHAPVAVNDAAIGWLQALGSDRMYVRLCRNQNCYRARLTPKPFRVGCPAIQGHYPFERGDDKKNFDRWLEAYRRNSEPYAVCKFIGQEGETRVHAALEAVVREHDRATRCNDDLPLA